MCFWTEMKEERGKRGQKGAYVSRLLFVSESPLLLGGFMGQKVDKYAIDFSNV